jgi:hypothetical protein
VKLTIHITFSAEAENGGAIPPLPHLLTRYGASLSIGITLPLPLPYRVSLLYSVGLTFALYLQVRWDKFMPINIGHKLSLHRLLDPYLMYVRLDNIWYWPVTVDARSKALTVFARTNSGIVGLNPIQGMYVWVFMHLSCVCVVLCLGSGLARG